MKRKLLALLVFLTVLLGIAAVNVNSVVGQGNLTPSPVGRAFFSPSPAATNTEAPTLVPTLYLTNTPPAVYGGAKFIADDYSTVLFPVALHFDILLRLNAKQIKEATLHIYQPGNGSFDVTIPPSVEKTVQALNDNDSRLIYDWQFDVQNAPQLFKPIYYEWKITSENGATATVSHSLTFQDTQPSNFKTWHTTAAPLQLFSHNDALSLILLQADLARIHDRITADTGINHDFRFVIYDPDAKFCQQASSNEPGKPKEVFIVTPLGIHLPCDPTAGPRIYTQQGYALVRRPNLTLAGTEDQLTAIMVDDAYGALWANSPKPPEWFQQGLRQLYGIVPHSPLLNIARDASRSNALLPLSTMAGLPPSNAQQARLWNAQSYLLVLYIVSKYGPAAPSTIAYGMNLDGYTFEQALQIQFKTTPGELYSDWQKWLIGTTAETALRYSPYIETATPTITITLSNTPTQRPPTNTFTPSATEVPFYTITPLPTHTALPPGTLARPQ